ncbi:hypothetical protein CMI37_28505 [Candidatus Pacearchaeota archaeon]|nr:hypothetical protein [Candidatus Pacearchaeota archaeon]|tara:strand:- start:2228 stop:2485 length:258 start_codon:yes stop_codon:yes gene_type:complete
MNRAEIEIDFTEQIRQLRADKEAGYPPKCNPGYKVSEDGKKCVKIEEEKASQKQHARRRVGTTSLTRCGGGLCPDCECNPCQCGS